jgi:leucyl-tRNA---protein transferase
MNVNGPECMTDQSSFFPDFHVTMAQPCPYLPGKLERKLFTHLTPDKPSKFIDKLLRNGFRRSQNVAYLPYCNDCHACVSVRILVDRFEPGKSFKRLKKRNLDLVAKRVKRKATNEQYELFNLYINARHGDGGMAEMDHFDFSMMIEESEADTFLTEYRLRSPLDQSNEDETALEETPSSKTGKNPLIAVSLCDRLSDGVSMVYSFFNPQYASRSLGSYMILEHVDYARKQGLPFLYLGYWIDGCRKMSYKSRFNPQQHLTPDGWEEIGQD